MPLICQRPVLQRCMRPRGKLDFRSPLFRQHRIFFFHSEDVRVFFSLFFFF